MKLVILMMLGAVSVLAGPTTDTPGNKFEFPARPTGPGAPVIYENSREAGPDETFLMVGENVTTNVVAWGVSAINPAGQEYKLQAQLLKGGLLAVTIPEKAQDGPFVVWVRNSNGYSAPIVLNAPQPWWCTHQNGTVYVYGRNLARRPDCSRVFVYLCQPGKHGVWTEEVVTRSKYTVAFGVPRGLAAGEYELWMHVGNGGEWGWGGPVKLRIEEETVAGQQEPLEAGTELQAALDRIATRGGGTLNLAVGRYSFRGTLRVPMGVRLDGAGRDATTLQLVNDPTATITNQAAVWLAGSGAGVRNLTILGNSQVNVGIVIQSPQPRAWVTNCIVQHVGVADIDGKQGENCGVRVVRAYGSLIERSELWGRAPIFIAGAKQCQFFNNRLVSVTRFGGNAEAAILGRCDTIEECVIENNGIACPPGADAGGPTARRMLWFSTGHGSVTHNWIANNGTEGARFGGVAGTDQNVGETILFEANHRTMFFGALAGADAQSVTLPKTVPRTPDERLGTVKREQLAHDAAGNETPFWPPEVDDGTTEPPIHEYYVTVFKGRGQGQTRRVVKREGEKLLLDRPWNVPPTAGSVVVVGTAFYQNLIVGNQTPDGMTGIQLWISCIENVISGNTIARQRKPGLFLYANGTTLASSMPRTWNRGISPLFWNVAEGNRAEECSVGALVTSGDAPGLPVEFPRALGNVLRHNSFIRNRTDGVTVNASAAGTIAEFNVVRDALVGYRNAAQADATVFRRNHAYFWYPVSHSTNAPVAFQVDDPDATVAIEKNSIESVHGVSDKRVIDLKRGQTTERLPEK